MPYQPPTTPKEHKTLHPKTWMIFLNKLIYLVVTVRLRCVSLKFCHFTAVTVQNSCSHTWLLCFLPRLKHFTHVTKLPINDSRDFWVFSQQVQRAETSFVISTRPSVRPSLYSRTTVEFSLGGCSWNFIFDVFTKISPGDSVLLKAEKLRTKNYVCVRVCTCVCIYIYTHTYITT